MPRIRHILDALRVAALRLLMVSVFFGPAGLRGPTAFASASKTCGVSCPCDEAVHDGHEGDAGDHEQHANTDRGDDDRVGGSGHEDDEPCQDQCPDNCPNCGCCLGIGMAVLPLPLPMTSTAIPCASTLMLAPMDAPANGACSGVFRPPRSLT
jgi:hypothetical protein